MGQKNGKPGADPYEAPWDQIKKLAAMQCTVNEIANFLGKSVDTLERCAKRDFDVLLADKMHEWRDGGRCSLRRKQWLLADKNASMAIFLGKQFLGQKDDYSHRHSGDISMEIVHYGDNEPKQWSEKPEQ